MKKNIITVCVLLTVSLFMFVSCSGSLTDTLLKVMDSTSTNVFEQTGLVKPDTSKADNAINALKTETVTVTTKGDGSIDISEQKGFEAFKELDLNLTISSDLAKDIAENGILAPQTAEQKQQIANAVIDGNSATQNKLKSVLEKNVSPEDSKAVKGSMAVVSVVFSKLSENVSSESEVGNAIAQLAKDFEAMATGDITITEGDKVCVQLATNMAVSGAKAFEKLNSGTEMEELMKDEDVKAFISDATLLYDTSKLSAGNVGTAVQDLTNLINTKEDGASKDITVDIPDELKSLIPNLVENLLGKDVSKYDSKIRSYKSMVNAKNAKYVVVKENLEALKKNKDKYAALKDDAPLSAVIEYLAATAVSKLDEVKYDGVSFLVLIKDVVESSGDDFFNDLSKIKASKYEATIQKLFAGSDSEIKKVMTDLLKELQVNASTADKMLIIDNFDLSSIIGNGAKNNTISSYLEDMIEKMNSGR